MIGHVARHGRAQVIVNVVAGLDHAGEIKKIKRGRVTEAPGRAIEHLHRRTADTQMDTGAPDLKITFLHIAEHGGIGRCHRDELFDHRARQKQVPIAIKQRSVGNKGCLATFRRIGHADPLEQIKGRANDRFGISFREWLERAAVQAGPDHGRQRHRLAAVTTASVGSTRSGCLLVHGAFHSLSGIR